MFKPTQAQIDIEIKRLMQTPKWVMFRFNKVYHKRITNLSKHLCASSKFAPSFNYVIDRYNDCFDHQMFPQSY